MIKISYTMNEFKAWKVILKVRDNTIILKGGF